MIDIRKKFMSNNSRTRNMNKNIIVSLLLKGGSIVISLLLVPLTLSYLTNLEYGIWLTISSVLHWIDYFDIGLSNGLRNKLAESISMGDMETGRVYVSTTFALLSLIILFLYIIYIAINPFMDWNQILNTGNNSISNLNEIVMIIFTIISVNFVFKIIGTIYIAYQQPMINNLFSFLGNLFSLIIIYIMSLTTDGSLEKVAIAFSIAPLIVYFFAIPYTFIFKYKNLTPSFKYINIKYSKSLVGLGIEFFILQIVCLILYSTSNIIIASLFSPDDVTPYNIGYRYVNIVSMVFSIIMSPMWTAITDAYSRKEYTWIRSSIRRMEKIWLIASIMIFIMIFISEPVIKLWTGGKVYVPFQLIVFLGIYISLLMLSSIYSHFSNGIGKIRTQIISAVIEAIIFIPLTLVLSKYFGINGVAISLALVTLIPCIMLYIFYKKTMIKLL